MSSFFEPPPPPPEPPPEPPRRPWVGARHNEIGRAVALNLMLGRSDSAALWISAATVYTDGFEFEVQLQHRLDEELVDPFFMHVHGPRRRGWSPEEGLDPSLLRFGVQFSDGGKATNLPDGLPFRGGPDAVPSGPVLWPGGGGGGGGRWRHDFWVWPLPPEGPLAFVCEWPAAGIPETRSEIDSAVLRDAAADAAPLWSDTETPSDSGDWTSYGTHQVVLSAQPPAEPEEPADQGGLT